MASIIISGSKFLKHGGLAKDDKVFAEMLNFNGDLEGIIKVIKEK